MKEIEVKILDVDVEKIILLLESFGAKKVLDANMQILYLDTPLHELQKNKSILRLRTKDEKAELTFKKVLRVSDVKEMDEINIEIPNIKFHLDLFVLLGYVVTKKHQKHRISYKLKNCSFELDTFDGIPTFLEIESDNTEDIYYWVEKLGFTKKDMKSWSGSDVLRHYSQ